MAIKELKKPIKSISISNEKQVDSFISKGGTLPVTNSKEYHRLVLHIPKILMDRIDVKRKERMGKISRTLWIIEVIEKSTR